jgi:hypothetical protein
LIICLVIAGFCFHFSTTKQDVGQIFQAIFQKISQPFQKVIKSLFSHFCVTIHDDFRSLTNQTNHLLHALVCLIQLDCKNQFRQKRRK